VNPLGRPEREGVKSDLREMEELRGFGAAGEGERGGDEMNESRFCFVDLEAFIKRVTLPHQTYIIRTLITNK
jgi:hypothetical protein